MYNGELAKKLVEKLKAKPAPPLNLQPPPPPKNNPPPCQHTVFELYHQSCLKCNTFCNCGHTSFPKRCPDVLVRSLDKHIVRLSGNLVRASTTLYEFVEFEERKVARGMELEKECVVIKMEENTLNPVIEYRRKGVDDTEEQSSSAEHPELRGLPRGADNWGTCELMDLLEPNAETEVFVLFDTESDRPTLGITKEILTKIDYYITMHLHQVDERVRVARRRDKYCSATRYMEEIPAELEVNTFAYEDWEEKFFDVHPGQFLDMLRANQELLIWDLFYAIEKWIILFRGFPKRMVNGSYDLIRDRDYENDDHMNPFGLPWMEYDRPRRKCRHRFQDHCTTKEIQRTVTPKWWKLCRGVGSRAEEMERRN